MTRPVIECIVDARLHGVTRVPLTLCYRVADPAALALSLLTCGGPVSWLAARDALRDGLDVDRVVAYAGEPAAAVQLSTRPGCHEALLTLRTRDRVRFPLTVPVEALAAFIGASYIACSPQREAEIVAEELYAQLGFFAMTHDNERGNPA